MTSDTALPVELDREKIDAWLSANCGKGLPHGEATDEASMLHGLAYVLRQIEGTDSYKVNIGQCTSATSALRMALDHFATRALSATRTDLWEPIETAPKDGTEIILGGKGWSNAGFYSGDEDQMRRAEAGWFFEDDRGNLLIARNIDPTHWQPLPAPPITTEGE